MAIKNKREVIELVDKDTDKNVGLAVNLTAYDENGDVLRQVQLSKSNDGLSCFVGVEECDAQGAFLGGDWQGITINYEEACALRNWLVKEYPFSKQELVNLMTEEAKNG